MDVESLLISGYVVPGKNDPSMGEYSHAQYANRQLQAADGDPARVTTIVTEYIFDTHPDELDLPPAVLHRFQQAQQIMTTYEGGQELLQASILNHFKVAERGLEQGYATAVTAIAFHPDPDRPRAVRENGKFVQRVRLPEDVQRKALVWNRWVQQNIEAGQMEYIFGGHPQWVAVKLGEGSWLQAGNLMAEPAEGIARIRTPAHDRHNLLERWGLGGDDDFFVMPDEWFLMTHIMDKELLMLADQIGDNMIDGTKLTQGVYARSYRPIVQIIDANPKLKIKGVLSDGTWIYSSELPRLFPHQAVAGLHLLAGDVVDIGSAEELGMPAQRTFATHDPERRAAATTGNYAVTIAARFITAAGMRAIIEEYSSER